MQGWLITSYNIKLYIHIYIYICMYVCMYVFMYVCMGVVWFCAVFLS